MNKRARDTGRKRRCGLGGLHAAQLAKGSPEVKQGCCDENMQRVGETAAGDTHGRARSPPPREGHAGPLNGAGGSSSHPGGQTGSPAPKDSAPSAPPSPGSTSAPQSFSEGPRPGPGTERSTGFEMQALTTQSQGRWNPAT